MLATVEIPGYADALRKEAAVRRGAFVHNRDAIAGVPVRQMTLGDMLWLEELRNGFFCPFKFETHAELAGHSAHLVWWLSDCPKPDPYAKGMPSWRVIWKRERLFRELARKDKELVEDAERYLTETFMDAPKGTGTNFAAPSAAMPASVMDLCAAAGYSFTVDQVMDIPLVRLWQILRLGKHRIDGVPLTNPSDKIATDYLASLAKQQGAN